MDEITSTFEHEGLIVELWNDDASMFESPFELDGCIANFVGWHKRYNLGPQDKRNGVEVVHRNWDGLNIRIDGRTYEARGWGEMSEIIRKHCKPVICYPVWMIDHSMLAFRAGSSFADIDPGQWDSGLVGFLFARPDVVREQYGVKRITGQVIERVMHDLAYDLEAYGNWINGWMYGFTIKDGDGNELENTGGFYTSEEAKRDAKSEAAYFARCGRQTAA